MTDILIKKIIEEFVIRRRKYFIECEEIRNKEQRGEIYAWKANELIRGLDIGYLECEEKKNYLKFKELIENDSELEKKIDKIHSDFFSINITYIYI